MTIKKEMTDSLTILKGIISVDHKDVIKNRKNRKTLTKKRSLRKD